MALLRLRLKLTLDSIKQILDTKYMNWKMWRPVVIWGLVFYFIQTFIVLFIDLLIGVYAEDIVIMIINTLVAGVLGYFFTPHLIANKELSRNYEAWKLGGMLGVVSVAVEILLSSLFFFNLNVIRWALTILAAGYGGKLSSTKR